MKRCRIADRRAVATRRYGCFQCPTSAGIALHSAVFFDLVPSHVSLAQVQNGDGSVIQQIFTKDNQTRAISGPDEGLSDAGLFKYVQMGIMHIFTGVDHMSFLLGLVLCESWSPCSGSSMDSVLPPICSNCAFPRRGCSASCSDSTSESKSVG